eukprot:CAMPEP_0176018072 /NCGR_PEP_ID=MMETSP0120_2-20121206/8689_1 /TAXON_ID=160619 /ORGANISM="Kryptoperidinium foliaceum, Strain CCMP 1326" /LENGTH=289 /DNA_ID=CAMNT_0017351111 /DNA_START=217 /DNA_END=1082 /DNA_ORIENTATION=+
MSANGGGGPSTPVKSQEKQEGGFKSPFQSLQKLRQRHRSRRSRSAPPKLRTPLIEHHFRVDRERRVVLPGVPKHEDDWYRDTHDFFNLIVLIPIIVLDVMNWNWEKMFRLKKKETISDAWTGEWFDLFFACTALYFLVDLLWILVIPKCVKSPATIIQHHIATLLYILVPYYITVELNTWCLIARRVFNKAGFPPWIIDLSFVSIRIKLISILFYITWIGIRCILYPLMMGWILNRWLTQSQKMGYYLNVEIISPILHSTFCILNFKWTYDLIMSKIRYYKKRSLYPKG